MAYINFYLNIQTILVIFFYPNKFELFPRITSEN